MAVLLWVPRISPPLVLLVLAALAASVMMAVVLARPAQATDYTVTNTNDSGAGSLRQAIFDANATAGADEINFILGSSATITLSSQLPAVTDTAGLAIDGGNANTTISGNDQVRVFEVGSSAKLTLSNLTVADGFVRSDVFFIHGGGIWNGGTLTVSDSTFSDNKAKDGDFDCQAGSLVGVLGLIISCSFDGPGGAENFCLFYVWSIVFRVSLPVIVLAGFFGGRLGRAARRQVNAGSRS